MSVKASCKVCGATFRRFPSEAKAANLFCSNRCQTTQLAANRCERTKKQFWSRIATGSPDECWPWQGFKNRKGYGQTAWMGKVLLAHRVALSLSDGDWESRLLVCHICDFPACCNPAHLWRGTVGDNTRDMVAKGRQVHPRAKGEKNGWSKLTEDAVRNIRSSELGRVQLAEKYGVTKTYINQIRRRDSWRHIP